jgi:hypothetical protein
MSQFALRSFAFAAAMFATATAVPAQSVADFASPAAAVMVPGVTGLVATDARVGPRVTQAAVALPVSAAETALAGSLQSSRGTERSNVAWMAVGGAALVIGLLVGGDAGSVIAITGGVIGLIGLFRYMN